MNDEIALPSGSVDLIYLDPPFNSKSNYNLPFKGRLARDVKPVEAFKDTWTWGTQQDEYLRDLQKGPSTRVLADFIQLTQKVEASFNPGAGGSLSAYLVNMAVRLIPMKRILSKTGSIYLHCDPTASHYLKMVMDAIFGQKNFRNEIIWGYRTGGVSKHWFPKKHDVLLAYGKVPTKERITTHIAPQERIYYDVNFMGSCRQDEDGRWYADVYIRDIWDDKKVKAVLNMSHERLGYPTQKPLALLERIIRTSSNEGDIVLDPFCGCGTTLHAAETLKRNWIGIDISKFSAGLVRERIATCCRTPKSDIQVIGNPTSLSEARKLVKTDPFEFEKWVCGEIGAHGMFREPGERGADGGVDGVIRIALFEELGKIVKEEYILVQVKGGKVTPDAVRALTHSVEQYEAKAGILVCFDQYLRTVENNRSKKTYSDVEKAYPVIQGFSIEQLLKHQRPNIPPVQLRKGAKLVAPDVSQDQLKL